MKIGVSFASSKQRPYLIWTEDVFHLMEEYDSDIIISKDTDWVEDRLKEKDIDYHVTIYDDYVE